MKKLILIILPLILLCGCETIDSLSNIGPDLVLATDLDEIKTLDLNVTTKDGVEVPEIQIKKSGPVVLQLQPINK